MSAMRYPRMLETFDALSKVTIPNMPIRATKASIRVPMAGVLNFAVDGAEQLREHPVPGHGEA